MWKIVDYKQKRTNQTRVKYNYTWELKNEFNNLSIDQWNETGENGSAW